MGIKSATKVHGIEPKILRSTASTLTIDQPVKAATPTLAMNKKSKLSSPEAPEAIYSSK